jgi:hypothetical protein
LTTNQGYGYKLYTSLQEAPASEEGWDCDRSSNFIAGLEYRQISLTDACPSCSANPRYCSTAGCNDPEKAIAYCKEQCGEGCAGFFFQRHTNGHEICGFYSTNSANPASFDRVWHGHAHGAICISSLSEDSNSEAEELPTNLQEYSTEPQEEPQEELPVTLQETPQREEPREAKANWMHEALARFKSWISAIFG